MEHTLADWARTALAFPAAAVLIGIIVLLAKIKK